MRTKLLITVFAMLVLVGMIPAAHAQTCEYPLIVLQGSVDANVVILLDSSGSMNEAIQSDDYDPNVRYSGSFSRSTDYNIGTSGTYSPRSFNYRWATTPTAYLVQSDQGEDGVYNGNYLNWIFFNATSTQRSNIPKYTRIQLAKTALYAVLDQADARVRFGVFKFNGSTGGTKISSLGTDRATIKSQVSTVRANGYTPLAETVVSIGNYYKNDSDAIQYACQRNFCVIITDGLPTQDDDNMSFISDDGDGYKLDDAAEYYKDADLRSDMDGQQYFNTYTIGMNIDAPILDETAQRGDGSYFSASNAAQLANSLARVLRDIVNRISAGSAVAVVSTEGDTQDYVYRGKFLPSDWTGYLEAFELPYTTGDLPVWEAGQELANRSPDSRTIFTTVSGTRRDFVTGQAANLMSALGAANNTEASNIISWTRGNTVTGYRDRSNGWLLGDIVDSSPVPVGPPGGYSLYRNYASFVSANAARDRVIYAGSNDGMLHCFLASTGEELWAYVPNNMLSKLKDIADPDYCHEFGVNLTPRVVDAYVNSAWRTVLIGGEKEGGKAYFALDVTDPRNPGFLWENNLSAVVESWALPTVVRMRNTNKYIAFVGSGLNSAGEARLVGMDLDDGSQDYNLLLSTVTGDYNMATAVTAVDFDYNEYADVMYVSDLGGHLWRIDLSSGTPTKQLLFDTGGQSIQAQPIVTVGYNQDVYIYFGTGRYVERDDMSDLSQNTYYCIIDRHDNQTVDKNDLVDQTTTINSVEAAKGWYIDLAQDEGERVTEANAIVAGIVYFTTYAPNSEPCSAGGTSWLYAVQFKNGSAYDGDEDSSNDVATGRATEIGDGIVAKPVIDIINQQVLVQGSDTRIHSQATLGQIRQLVVNSWQQRY